MGKKRNIEIEIDLGRMMKKLLHKDVKDQN
jgi:hypothetical protein